MATPKRYFQNGSFYHVYNRGANKNPIFFDEKDRERFLNSLIFYQQKETPSRFSLADFNPIDRSDERKFSIMCYCMMPNHFHLLLRQESEKGIEEGISLLQNSYTKYVNTKYDRSGYLFQGRYRSVNVITAEQLIYLTRYILINPYVDHLVNNLEEYKWSAYNEYFNKANENYCAKEEILKLFPNEESFHNFVLDYTGIARQKKDMEKLFID